MNTHNITELQILRGASGSNAAYVGRAGVLTADIETTQTSGFGVIRLHTGDNKPGGYLLIGTGGGGGTGGVAGSSGSSGTNGTSGANGTSGSSGTSGTSGTTGTSGTSGRNGVMGLPGPQGNAGSSGTSGANGSSGTSGTGGISGTAGTSGRDGVMGLPGPTGPQGSQGNAGSSGTSGANGSSGTSGANGSSGTSGTSGANGSSGTSGTSGRDGVMGLPGLQGASGSSGTSGLSGSSGTSGLSGSSGTAGTTGSSGTSGANGSSGTSGVNGSSGTSGVNGTSGTTGSSGTSGTSGRDGVMGLPGLQGASGSSGTSGINGSSGTSGINGSSGTSGANGSSGTSGISGTDGSSGTSGANGTSGTTGSSGTSGRDGVMGLPGLSGSSGTSGMGSPGSGGTSGTSGTGFSTISNPGNTRILTSDGGANTAAAQSNLTFDGGLLSIVGGIDATGTTILQGNVGIGTTDPAGYELNVNGVARVTQLNIEDTSTILYNISQRLAIRAENIDDVAEFRSYGLDLLKAGETAGLFVASPIEARTGLRIGNGAEFGTITVGATTTNTANRLVQRDASNAVFATTFHGELNGNATTATTASSVVRTVLGTNNAELVRGNMGNNDFARIFVGATSADEGFLEIATADNATEPIYVRQYAGQFAAIVNTATLLDSSGNTSFPGRVTANGVLLTGNVGTVTSVTGTGTTSGLTLSGTVTTSGNITLSGAVNSLAAGTYAIDISGNANTATIATTANQLSNAVTFNNGGAGDASGTTFDGAFARTISYNTIGAPSTTGANASGNWGINITGNAATATTATNISGYSGTYWTSNNDGAGSGLDADLLDGQQGSYYAAASSLGSYLPLGGGTLTGNLTAPNFILSSDKRLKEDIKPVVNALDIVKSINGYTYRMKETQQDRIGVIAQEVQEVLPQIVHTDKEGMLAVSYDELVPVLIEAIKELNTKLEKCQCHKTS